jgi:hypothetical protein
VAVKALKLAVKYDLRTLLFCEAFLILSLAYRVTLFPLRSVIMEFLFKLKKSILAGFNSPLGMDIRICVAMIASNTMISLLKLGFLNQIILATISK